MEGKKGLLEISETEVPAMFQFLECVFQNKHSWNSLGRHKYQSVDKLQTGSLRPREIPILEDNPADCFTKKIFSSGLSESSSYGAAGNCNIPGCNHMFLTCSHGDVNTPEKQRYLGDSNMINRPIVCLSNQMLFLV